MRSLTSFSALLGLFVVVATAAADPQYQIYDIGVVQSGDTASQGFGVSPGGVAVGRSFRSGGTQAYSWTRGGGLVGLPNLAGRSFCLSNSANDNGTVVGTGATTSFGSGRLPVIWQNGVVSQLPLPGGETLGDANHVNSSGVAVGSADAGISQRGVIYSGGSASLITQATPNGSYFLTAFGINDSGRVVGQGIDPNNAAVNVGIVYDISSNTAFDVGALKGMNGALAFGVSNSGYVVGSSMLNQGSGLPFIWSDANGIVPIPLAAGTSQGSARAVNSAGWAVGNDSSAFSIPFLYDGTTTYRLADLIPVGSGWDLSMNTSSSALGISDNNVIVGTGVFNGATHAYAMVPTLLPITAVSRKTHGAQGSFDIALPLSGSPGVECRSGGVNGNYTFAITFSNAVVGGTANVITGTGTVSGAPSFAGNVMTVNLTGVADFQTMSVTLNNVTDSFSQVLPTTAVTAKMLIGDANGNATVNATDIGLTKGQSGAAATSSNFRADIDANGTVNGSDVTQVKTNAGHSLP
ncbi:MAG TPA: dockerin type I domain-containing protein [Chthoniobacterales bacterium]|nr:dockerin type I domain-containing protein [Chthoniobacterales bacterium]